MTQKSSTNLLFQDVYTFPEPVEKHIWNLMKEYTKKVDHKTFWLHAPVGISPIGKQEPYLDDNISVVTFDIDDNLKPDIVGDIFNLHIDNNLQNYLQETGIEAFDGAISDPIWIEQKNCKCRHCGEITAYRNPKGLQYHKRRYISYEIRDVLKPNGLMIMNCLWNPWVIGFKKEKKIGTQADYRRTPGLTKKTTIEVIYQSFSSFRNVSLVWRLEKKTLEHLQID